jgi:hypothetical protein
MTIVIRGKSAVTNRQSRLEKIVRKDYFRPAQRVGGRYWIINQLIQFTLPFGNSRKIEDS